MKTKTSIPVVDLPGEKWKYVKDTDERYMVSNLGRIMTTKYKNGYAKSIMRPARNKSGYLNTVIVKGGKNYGVLVHRLVAEAFISNPENKPQINHINFVRDDNRVENLQWCTAHENTMHSYQSGRIQKPICTNFVKGSRIGTAKLDEQKVTEIRSKFVPYKYTRKKLAEEYGVSEATIKDVLHYSWKHVPYV